MNPVYNRVSYREFTIDLEVLFDALVKDSTFIHPADLNSMVVGYAAQKHPVFTGTVRSYVSSGHRFGPVDPPVSISIKPLREEDLENHWHLYFLVRSGREVRLSKTMQVFKHEDGGTAMLSADHFNEISQKSTFLTGRAEEVMDAIFGSLVNTVVRHELKHATDYFASLGFDIDASRKWSKNLDRLSEMKTSASLPNP